MLMDFHAEGRHRVIELLGESEQRRLRECATQAAEDFADSVRPIYRSSDESDKLPEHIGSCILLDVDGTKVVSTAAHIADDIAKGATLWVASPPRPQLVPILGGSIKATTAPHQDRRLDHSDCAFWRVPDDVVEDLGAANFLGTLSLSHNRSPLERRYYTSLGYAVSRNKDGVDHVQRSIAIIPSMHTSNAVSEPKLAKKLGAASDEHIFVRFEKRAQDVDGATVNTFHPKGFSGGALLDLGDFTSFAIYAGSTRQRALLSGMMIEYHPKHRAIVAVKIGPIVSGIRNALRRLS
jgi:hypothetical protein